MNTIQTLKKYSAALVVLAVLTASFSCQKQREKIKQVRQATTNTTKAVKNANEMTKNVRGMQEDMERLQELEPVSSAEFRAWLPDNLGDLKRVSYKAGGHLYNVASAEAEYETEDRSKRFKVTVMDGAGGQSAAGVLVSTYGLALGMDLEEETRQKHTRTVKRSGIEARQTEYKQTDRTELMFMYDNRFGVGINAHGMDADETWKHLSKLKFDSLGN